MDGPLPFSELENDPAFQGLDQQKKYAVLRAWAEDTKKFMPVEDHASIDDFVGIKRAELSATTKQPFAPLSAPYQPQSQPQPAIFPAAAQGVSLPADGVNLGTLPRPSAGEVLGNALARAPGVLEASGKRLMAMGASVIGQTQTADEMRASADQIQSESQAKYPAMQPVFDQQLKAQVAEINTRFAAAPSSKERSAEIGRAVSGALWRQQPILRAGEVITEGIPSWLVAIGATLLTKNPWAGASVLGAQQAGETYAAARDAGASELRSVIVGAGDGVLATLTEKIPFEKFIGNAGRRALDRFVRGASVEAFQELGQNVLSNAIAKYGYDEGRQLWDGWLESLVGGAGLGGIGGLAFNNMTVKPEQVDEYRAAGLSDQAIQFAARSGDPNALPGLKNMAEAGIAPDVLDKVAENWNDPTAKQTILDKHFADIEAGNAQLVTDPAMPAQQMAPRQPAEDALAGMKADIEATRLGGSALPDGQFELADDPGAGGRDAEVQAADRMAGLLGKRIVWFRNTDKSRINFRGTVTGDTIFIDAEAKRPFEFVLMHEATHTLETEAPDLHRQLIDVAKQEGTGFDAYKAELLDAYRAQGLQVNEGDNWVWNEIVADVMGEKGTDKTFWQNLYDKAPEAVRAIVDAIRSIVNRIQDRPSMAAYFSDYQKVVQTAESVLAEYATRKNVPQSAEMQPMPTGQTASPEAAGAISPNQEVQNAQQEVPPQAQVTADVPVMITRKMESDLKEMGYAQDAINKMTPQEAWDILKTQSAAGSAPAADLAVPKEAGVRPAAAPSVKSSTVNPALEDFRSQVKQQGVKMTEGQTEQDMGGGVFRGIYRKGAKQTVDQWLSTAYDMGLISEAEQTDVSAFRRLMTGENPRIDNLEASQRNADQARMEADIEARLQRGEQLPGLEKDFPALAKQYDGYARTEANPVKIGQAEFYWNGKAWKGKKNGAWVAIPENVAAQLNERVPGVHGEMPFSVEPSKLSLESDIDAWLSEGKPTRQHVEKQLADTALPDTMQVAYKRVLERDVKSLNESQRNADKWIRSKGGITNAVKAMRSGEDRNEISGDEQSAAIGLIGEAYKARAQAAGSELERLRVYKEKAEFIKDVMAPRGTETGRALRAAATWKTWSQDLSDPAAQIAQFTDMKDAANKAAGMPEVDRAVEELRKEIAALNKQIMQSEAMRKDVQQRERVWKQMSKDGFTWAKRNAEKAKAVYDEAIRQGGESLADIFGAKAMSIDRAAPLSAEKTSSERRLTDEQLKRVATSARGWIGQQLKAGREATFDGWQKYMTATYPGAMDFANIDDAWMLGEMSMGANLNTAARGLKTSRAPSMDTLVRRGIKDLGTTIEKIAYDHFMGMDETRDTLVNKLVAKAGLSGEEATAYATRIIDAFDKLVAAKRDKLIERVGIGRKGQSTMTRILQDIRIGGLDAEAVRKRFEEAYGLPSMTPEIMARLKANADAIDRAIASHGGNKDHPDVRMAEQNAMKYMASQIKTGWGGIFWGWVNFSLLSGPPTQFVNIASNAAQTVDAIAIRIEQQMLKAVTGDRTAIAKIGLMLEAFRRGVPMGTAQGKETLRTGIDPVKAGEKYDADPSVFNAFELDPNDLVGAKRTIVKALNWIKYNRRFMAASDIQFNIPMAEMHTALVMADRITDAESIGATELVRKVSDAMGWNDQRTYAMQADNEGLKGAQKWQRVHELMVAARPSEVTGLAGTFAADTLFMRKTPLGPAGRISNFLEQLGGAYPAFKPFTMYARIAANVTNQMLDHSMWGLVRGFSGKMKGMNGEVYTYDKYERADVLTKGFNSTIIGVILGAVAWHALKAWEEDKDPKKAEPWIQIHGDGPRNWRVKKEWLAQGGKPYTIRFGNGRYIAYNYFAPVAVTLAALGNMLDMERWPDEDTPRETPEQKAARFAYATLWGTVTLIRNSSPIASANNLFKFLNENNDEMRGKWMQNFFGGFSNWAVPGLVRWPAQFMDPKKYSAETIGAAFMRGIPVARGVAGLYPSINIMGDEIPFDPMGRFWTEPIGDTEMEWLVKNNIGVEPPDRNHAYPDPHNPANRESITTEREYWQLTKDFGHEFRKSMKMFIPHMHRLSDENKRKQVATLRRSALDIAESKLLRSRYEKK